jgi:hypothetical protein
MTRGQPPERGYYEVRTHQVDGVLGVFWVEQPGSSGTLHMVLGAERMPLLAKAVSSYMARAPRPRAEAGPEPEEPRGLRVVE